MIGSDLVLGALRLIGAVASGETPSSDEAADGFTALQQLLSEWSGDELAMFSTRTAAVTLAIGTASYSIPGARPVKVLSADVTVGGSNFPVKIVGPDKWANTPDKSDTSTHPRMAYCDYAYPTAGLQVAPIPSAVGALNLYCSVDLATLANQAATFDMPEAYTNAIRFALALKVAPEYGRAISPELAADADKSYAAIQKLNASNRAGASALELPEGAA
jgi:hypothetical protein